MAELPDDIVEQVRDELGMVLSVGSVRVLRAAYPLIAARVRAEAVAERAQIVAVIEQYLPEALPFNSLSEIVGGIARQRDFQHELKDHLSEVARRLTDERDAAAAGAVADERQRLADAILPDHWQTVQSWGGVQRLACGRCRYGDGVRFLWPCPTRRAITGEPEPEWDSTRLAAGSVPVATPEDHGWREHTAECKAQWEGWDHAADLERFQRTRCICGADKLNQWNYYHQGEHYPADWGDTNPLGVPVATPTEPADPTYGRIDPDIQRAVDEMEPESVGSRVAMENTLQARRDAATPTEPAGRHVCTDNPCHARHHAGYGQLCTVVGCTEDWCKGSHQGAASSAGRVALSSSHEPLPGRRT